MECNLTQERIRSVFLAHGFTIKEGHADLKPYVYEAAKALIEASLADYVLTKKPEVTALMQMARAMRLATPDFYDTAYKTLQTALYGFLTQIPKEEDLRQVGILHVDDQVGRQVRWLIHDMPDDSPLFAHKIHKVHK